MCNCVSLAPCPNRATRRLVLLPALLALLAGRSIGEPLVTGLALVVALAAAFLALRRRLDRRYLTIATILGLFITGAVTGRDPTQPITVDEARSPISHRADAVLSPRAARYARTVILGERAAIDPNQRLAYRRAGLTHILAVSGLHVGVIAGLAWGLARLVLGRGPIAEYASAATILAYVLGIGAPFSALRAGLMAVALFLGRALGRRAESLNLLFGAGFLTLLFDPTAAHDAGFQLSYAATAGLILWTRPIARFLPARPRIAMSLLAASIAAQALTIPLVLWHFREFAPIAFLANVAVLPVFGLLLPLLLLGLASLPFAPWLGDRLLVSLEEIIEALGRLPGAVFLVDRPPLPVIAILFGLAALPLVARGRSALRIAALLTVAALLLLAADSRESADGVHLIGDRDGGVGVVITEAGQVTLLDDGVSLTGWKSLLTGTGVTAVDTIIALGPSSLRFDRAAGLVEWIPVQSLSLPRRRRGNDDDDDDDQWRARRLEQYGIAVTLRDGRQAEALWRGWSVYMGDVETTDDTQFLLIQRRGPRAVMIMRGREELILDF